MSSGSSRADKLRSSRPDRTNITVSCRRSASGARGVGLVTRSATCGTSGSRSARIALSSLTRWPSGRPSSLRCSSVSSTSASAIDRVVGERLGILAKALRLQPRCNIGHDRPPGRRRRNVQPKYGLRPADCRRIPRSIWTGTTYLPRGSGRAIVSCSGELPRSTWRRPRVSRCSSCSRSGDLAAGSDFGPKPGRNFAAHPL